MPIRKAIAEGQHKAASDWLSLIVGGSLLYHEFWIVSPKDWTLPRLALSLLAAGVFTNSLSRRGGIVDVLGSLMNLTSKQINIRFKDLDEDKKDDKKSDSSK